MLHLLRPALAVVVCASAFLAPQSSIPPASSTWTQWGGPTRDFHVPDAGLASKWPEGGPPVIWSRPLGTGHSSIVVDEGRLFTMYRAGNGRAKLGPWQPEEVVVSLDAKTGKTIWEHAYPARSGYEDFSFGPGPHASPLVVGDRVFTIGTTQQFFAFDKRTGKILWSHDFVKEFKAPELLLRPQVKVGYGCSPIAWRDTIICSVGGPGQSVMAFRQADGAVVWRSGDFLTAAAAPILITMGGRQQLVLLGGGAVTGLDPDNGAILWSHPHDPGNDLNCTTPLFGSDNVLFMSSAYQAGSRAIQLTQSGGATHASELWFTNRVRFMFLSAIRVGDFVYGTTGDFGPAFLTALNIKTGESAWQVRGFQRASLLQAGDKTIILNEDGDLALAKLSPTGAEIISRAKLLDTVSWTAPTLVGTTLYARDREKIVAVALGSDGGTSPSSSTPATAPAAPTRGAQPATPPPSMSLAGSWTLDKAGSTVVDDAPYSGLVAKGAPPWMFVTQPTNGTVLVETAINTGHTRFYKPGAATTTDIANGVISMTTTWSKDGKVLVADGTVKASSGVVTPVRETLSRDADALVIEVTVGDKVSKFRYLPLKEVGPCSSWPTPCKKAAG
ncbi:MAG TPA: PQQ-binding-like beta-propeller repeat protein [Vicinamibacterales bacterium]|nr:PQQ-binding-like beta-propeller repeat protein [Vicinamibacterales bacterium]